MSLYTATSAAKVIKAIMSSGIIVKVEPNVFVDILAKTESPMVVTSRKKELFSETLYQYLTNYKGLFFYIETKLPLQLPDRIELVESAQMLILGS